MSQPVRLCSLCGGWLRAASSDVTSIRGTICHDDDGCWAGAGEGARGEPPGGTTRDTMRARVQGIVRCR